MAIRIANQTIILHRNGARMTVKPGQKMDFTKDEIEEIKGLNPDALRTAKNELEEAPEAKLPITGGDSKAAGTNRVTQKSSSRDEL